MKCIRTFVNYFGSTVPEGVGGSVIEYMGMKVMKIPTAMLKKNSNIQD